ncbi:hypothetical protein [Paenibacillus lactis]|uniref:hypothetical protein n=1 Tax=Paenibacillus lactis TaxID=228574 RepID=UPI003D70332A
MDGVDKHKESVIEYICNNTSLGEPLTTVIVEHSSFMELLKDDPEFIGHYPEEYWADYILMECRDVLERCAESLKS